MREPLSPTPQSSADKEPEVSDLARSAAEIIDELYKAASLTALVELARIVEPPAKRPRNPPAPDLEVDERTSFLKVALPRLSVDKQQLAEDLHQLRRRFQAASSDDPGAVELARWALHGLAEERLTRGPDYFASRLIKLLPSNMALTSVDAELGQKHRRAQRRRAMKQGDPEVWKDFVYKLLCDHGRAGLTITPKRLVASHFLRESERPADEDGWIQGPDGRLYRIEVGDADDNPRRWPLYLVCPDEPTRGGRRTYEDFRTNILPDARSRLKADLLEADHLKAIQRVSEKLSQYETDSSD